MSIGITGERSRLSAGSRFSNLIRGSKQRRNPNRDVLMKSMPGSMRSAGERIDAGQSGEDQ